MAAVILIPLEKVEANLTKTRDIAYNTCDVAVSCHVVLHFCSFQKRASQTGVENDQ